MREEGDHPMNNDIRHSEEYNTHIQNMPAYASGARAKGVSLEDFLANNVGIEDALISALIVDWDPADMNPKGVILPESEGTKSTMYWWNTKKLAADIKAGKLPERQKKNYFLATGIMAIVVLYLFVISPAEDPVVSLLTTILQITIFVFGVRIIFKTNQGAEGHDFVGRVVVLSWPINIKLTVFSFVCLIILAIAAIATESKTLNPLIGPALAILFGVLYFWRLNVHLKEINT